MAASPTTRPVASTSVRPALACDVIDIEFPLKPTPHQVEVKRACFASGRMRVPPGNAQIDVWSWPGYNNRKGDKNALGTGYRPAGGAGGAQRRGYERSRRFRTSRERPSTDLAVMKPVRPGHEKCAAAVARSPRTMRAGGRGHRPARGSRRREPVKSREGTKPKRGRPRGQESDSPLRH